MSKTACVYHSIDLDGFMSAAIVKHWYLTNVIQNDKTLGDIIVDTILQEYVPKEPIFKDTNNLWFIGYNYGQPIPDLSKYDKVIMCDVSFPKEEMEELHLKLCKWYSDKFVWIDHHISAIKDNGEFYDGIRDTKFAACELTWKYFFPDEPMPEIVRLLGRYDCFGSHGADEEQKVLEFQYGARQYISNYNEAYQYLIESIIEKENKEKVNKKNRKWTENNYKKKYSNSKNSKLLKEYGITLEEYNKMLETQNHCCKICGKEETQELKGTKWKLSVDHCHTTGKVRGLLCAKCNVGLAKFEEDEQQFLNAIKYLKGEL